MLIHPNITLTVDHLDRHDIDINGFCRDGYNGDYPDIEYLCYRKVKGEIVKITIVQNPYLKMAKQDKGELFVFKAVNIKDAKRCANEAIIKFQTGQRLYGVMTTRQAVIRIHKFDKTFTSSDLEHQVEFHNRVNGTQERIYQYGHRKYISKEIVEYLIDYLDFSQYER